ncbi:MAG: type II toxin-antitoxin system RelE/ParE family toxin [bacterium]
MKVLYRELFLKDLKKLRKQPIYEQIVEFAFTTLPKIKTLREVSGVKAMRRHPKRYRIRISNYRMGIEVKGDTIEIMRVLHRGEFYRYFP